MGGLQPGYRAALCEILGSTFGAENTIKRSSGGERNRSWLASDRTSWEDRPSHTMAHWGAIPPPTDPLLHAIEGITLKGLLRYFRASFVIGPSRPVEFEIAGIRQLLPNGACMQIRSARNWTDRRETGVPAFRSRFPSLHSKFTNPRDPAFHESVPKEKRLGVLPGAAHSG